MPHVKLDSRLRGNDGIGVGSIQTQLRLSQKAVVLILIRIRMIALQEVSGFMTSQARLWHSMSTSSTS